MPRTIDEYAIIIIDEETCFKARLKGMPLSATGATEEDAIENLKKAYNEEFNNQN